jgi:hypothetical protein
MGDAHVIYLVGWAAKPSVERIHVRVTTVFNRLLRLRGTLVQAVSFVGATIVVAVRLGPKG